LVLILGFALGRKIIANAWGGDNGHNGDGDGDDGGDGGGDGGGGGE